MRQSLFVARVFKRSDTVSEDENAVVARRLRALSCLRQSSAIYGFREISRECGEGGPRHYRLNRAGSRTNSSVHKSAVHHLFRYRISLRALSRVLLDLIHSSQNAFRARKNSRRSTRSRVSSEIAPGWMTKNRIELRARLARAASDADRKKKERRRKKKSRTRANQFSNALRSERKRFAPRRVAAAGWGKKIAESERQKLRGNEQKLKVARWFKRQRGNERRYRILALLSRGASLVPP